MAYSDTISMTSFNTSDVVDDAYRLCGLAPQQVTPEMQDVALQQLYVQLSAMPNRGIPLWAIDKQILPLQQGQQTVIAPVGTIDVLNAQYRTLTQYTGTESERLGGVATDLGTATKISTVGVKLAGTYTLLFETSSDGVTWTQVGATEATAFSDTVWSWFDIDGPASAQYFCIRDQAGSTLVFTSTYLGGNPYELPMARLNKDDYAQMPNKTYEGQPLQFWLDRQLPQALMRLWPAADASSATAQIVIWRHRHIMDVGTLVQSLEIPQRWFDAISLRLASRLVLRTPQADASRIALIKGELDIAEPLAWGEERDNSPMRLTYNLSAYTA